MSVKRWVVLSLSLVESGCQKNVSHWVDKRPTAGGATIGLQPIRYSKYKIENNHNNE